MEIIREVRNKEVKLHHWRGEYASAGSAFIETGRTDLSLSRVIFKNKRVRINNISKDGHGSEFLGHGLKETANVTD